MKRICSTLAIVLACYCSYAQNNFPNSGPATIGASVPSNQAADIPALWMANATALLPISDANYSSISLSSNIVFNSSNSWALANSSLPAWRLILGRGPNSDAFAISRSAPTTFSEQFYFGILNNGNVGIGTTTPDSRLAVNGTIHSKEVKVDLSNWSDYVFKPQYTLPTLKEVKTFIDQNQHLPGIPSEGEVIKNGVNLGEMNKLLLKKIEELTLYLIEKDKQVADQNTEMKVQQEQLKQSKAELEQVKKQQEERLAALEKKFSALTQSK